MTFGIRYSTLFQFFLLFSSSCSHVLLTVICGRVFVTIQCPSVRPFVCLSVPFCAAAAAGLLLLARQAGDIDRQRRAPSRSGAAATRRLATRRSAARRSAAKNASSVTFIANEDLFN